ncbi:MAG: hypothetical protein J3K34DRAFT_400971 [Monoraphidium minutum]|nr:MAG: hypothetical protein J3K34DRAFT_400971 [Monoraphidium minutum]
MRGLRRASSTWLVVGAVLGLCAAAPAAPPPPAPRLSPACQAAATSDLDARVAAPGFSGAPGGSWGPPAAPFPPAPPAPAGCDGGAWACARLLGAIQRLVALGFCYCHHHAPWWDPPVNARGATSSCNADCVGTRARPYQGVDCSNYSSYLYSLALGARFTSGIGKQACMPGAAPGRLLPFTAAQQELFLPGDLLYITKSLAFTQPGAPAARVSHVAIWTGLTADFETSGWPLSWDSLLANTKPSARAAAAAAAAAARAAGHPVYVISDSHWTGPNYRPFAGWYVSSFSHARRVIGAAPDAGAPPAAAAAAWDGQDCTSSLCCRGGAGGSAVWGRR